MLVMMKTGTTSSVTKYQGHKVTNATMMRYRCERFSVHEYAV
jgi:hypothetical protein